MPSQQTPCVALVAGDPADVIAQINALGYGLTCGIQTRIDSRAQALAAMQLCWRRSIETVVANTGCTLRFCGCYPAILFKT